MTAPSDPAGELPSVGPIDPLQVPRFAGPSTFARLPRRDEVDRCDVAVLGVPFDGPMPEHAPGMGWHYDLHVWFWEDNPAGLFVPFNTAVTCP